MIHAEIADFAASLPPVGAIAGLDLGTKTIGIAVSDGDTVAAGDLIVVLEAMKMEQPITAHKAGTVTALNAQAGAVVSSGAAICEIKE